MQITDFPIDAVKLITPNRFADARGYFSELYSKQALSRAGITDDFVQDNTSLSAKIGTIRGLHFQLPPHAQAKLVRVSRGRIVDVAVDLRSSSPTYRQHIMVELSATNGAQLYVPVGFAHGFCTLEPDTEVVYKVSSYYAPQSDAGILWSDPALEIAWPVSHDDVTVSEKDARLPKMSELSGQAF